MSNSMSVPRLKKNAVGLWGSYGQAMAVTAPLGSVVSSLFAGALYAGANLPLVTFFAFVTSCAWIYLLSCFSSKINSAGGFYTYCANSLGGKVGYFEATTEFMAFLFTTVFEGMYVGIIVPSLIGVFGIEMPTWSWAPLTALGIGLAIPLTYYDIAKTITKYVAVAATLEVVLLIGLGLYFVFKAGPANTVKVFTDINLAPHGLSGLATGYLLAVISVAGAGTATYLGEETKIPSKNIRRGMWVALILGGASMILSSYSVVVTWGITHAADLGGASVPLVKLAAKVSAALAVVTVLLAVNSLIVSNVGTNIAASRILFSLAREGGVPSKLASVHGKHRSPYIASIFVGTVAVVVGLTTPLLFGFVDAYQVIAVAASVFWIMGRMVDSVSLPFFYYKKFIGEFNIVKHTLAPIVITAINAVGLGLTLLPPVYPSNFSIILVTSILLLWNGFYFFVKRGNTDMIGSYVVNDAGELLLSTAKK
ncbi:MAG: APC family permease [Thermoprotei archaeon]